MMRALLMDLRKPSLPFADSETTQPVDVFRGVIAPASWRAASQGERPEPLAEPEPARGYAEFIGAFADRECTLLRKHAPTIKLTDRFL